MSNPKTVVVLAAGLATALIHVAAASAQEEPQPTPAPPDPTPTPVVEAPPPAPPPAPDPVPEEASAPPALAPASAVVAPAPTRPVGLSFGLGLGYQIPADVMAPTESSARVRLVSGITLEPRLSMAFFEQTIGDQPEASDSTTELGVTLDVRVPVRTRGKVDLLAIIGGGVAQTTQDQNDGASTTTTSAIELHYGLGVEYWRSSQWVISLTTTNPIIARSARTRDDGFGNEVEDSTVGFGAIFRPNVTAMIHLFL